MKASLEFDAATHTYTLDGRRLPSVTQVIKAVIPYHLPSATEWHRQRGTALHAATHLLDEGALDWSTVDPAISGRLAAYQKFRQHFVGDLNIEASEKPIMHPTYRYAGCLDKVFFIPGMGLILADLKSTIDPTVQIQLGGYACAWNANEKVMKIRRAFALELHDDETYRTQWFDDAELKHGMQQFLACLTVHNFLAQHNLLPKGD